MTITKDTLGTSRVNPQRLALIVPCYNEAHVLPKTIPIFIDKIRSLIEQGQIEDKSFILFCNDGSTDRTWEIIREQASKSPMIHGISLSRNRGHQNVLLAGLMEVKDQVDIAITIDCDGQDDINAMDEMIRQSQAGVEIVYGVRKNRASDSWFKRTTAESFYRLMKILGADIVFNHADYRLTSARVLKEFSRYGEKSIFLRGLFPLVGFRTGLVEYDRNERIAGESHYPVLKMLGFAWDGITGLSVKPIRLIGILGFSIMLIGLGLLIWALASENVPLWTGSAIFGCLIGGIQLLSLYVIGEYIGKIYIEAKDRPRYIIENRL